MPAAFGSPQAKPLYRLYGTANAGGCYLVAPCTIVWFDSTTDVIAAHRSAYALPENAATIDRTAAEFVVLALKGVALPARQLYAVRVKDLDNADALLTAAIGSAPSWLRLRWILRGETTDYEQS